MSSNTLQTKYSQIQCIQLVLYSLTIPHTYLAHVRRKYQYFVIEQQSLWTLCQYIDILLRTCVQSLSDIYLLPDIIQIFQTTILTFRINCQNSVNDIAFYLTIRHLLNYTTTPLDDVLCNVGIEYVNWEFNIRTSVTTLIIRLTEYLLTE